MLSKRCSLKRTEVDETEKSPKKSFLFAKQIHKNAFRAHTYLLYLYLCPTHMRSMEMILLDIF